MATAGANKKYQAWHINDKLGVSVHKIDPVNTDAKLIFDFFFTARSHVEMKTHISSGKKYVQIPILHSSDKLSETFRKHFKMFVTKDNNFVVIPIDDFKSLPKKRFCEVILEECQTFTLNYAVKLEFCTLMDHNFDEAVKVCDARMKSIYSKQGKQKEKKSRGPSVVIVQDSLENVKVDAIACTTSSDFNLSRGSASKALLKRCGDDLQKALYDGCRGNRDIGEVIPVPGSWSNCRMILFGAMYPFEAKLLKHHRSKEDYYRSSIHDFMQRCLNLAEKKRIKSMSFPAVGTGNLDYPVDIVADQMFKTITNWQGTFVKEIKFVIYGKDVKVLQKFKQIETTYGVPTVPSSHTDKTQTSKFYIENPSSNATLMKHEKRFPLPQGYTTEFIKKYCSHTINDLKKSDCDVSFTNDSIVVRLPLESYQKGTTRINDNLQEMKDNYPEHTSLDVTNEKFKLSDIKKKVNEIENTTDVICSFSNSETQLTFYGKMVQAVKDAKDKVVSLLLPPRDSAEQSNQKEVEDQKCVGTKPKAIGFSRQFSWSTRTKALHVFETKEKVTVKVYSSDILCVSVDCIVNAAYTNLKHGGGLARAIADAAGRDLTKEGRDYLKQHGKLNVGEVCSTGAGKLNYRCVIHAVGPCWSDYEPYSLNDIDRCGTDLYNAVINSLSEAEKLHMETIAVSSIGSGIYGCPKDLCCVQYAKAVVDYSELSKAPLKEIHFVDTSMEMVKVLHETFQSMIPDGHMPKSYNKLMYVKVQPTHRKFKDGKINQIDKKPDRRDSDVHKSRKEKGQVVYPYCHKDYPPGHSQKEFACCFGPGQNLYIYSADILSITSKDVIVCGNSPDGKTKGYLANAIKARGGVTYKTAVTTEFAKKPKEGNVVVCSSGSLPNFKWVAHAILYKKKNCNSEDRKWKVTSSFRNIFDVMNSKHCESIALPLVGTGKGNADPDFYGQCFFDALGDFASFNKDHRFKVHLVHNDKKVTKKTIEIIDHAFRSVHPWQVRTHMPKYQTNISQQNKAARPKSAMILRDDICGQNQIGSNRKSFRQNLINSDRQPQSGKQSENSRMVRVWHEDANISPTTTKSWNDGRKEGLRNSSNLVGKTPCQEEDNLEMESENRNKLIYKERESRHKDSAFHGVNRRSSSDMSPDRSEGSDQNSPTEKAAGNLRIFEETPQKKTDQIVAEQDNHSKPDEAIMKMCETAIENTSDDNDDESDGEDEEVYDVEPTPDDGPDKADEDDEGEVETCVICMDEITDPRTLSCGHVFCTECIEAQFTYKEVCPTCGNVCGIITGDQPYGKMDVIKNDRASCAGFEGCGRIEITYKFPDGTQGPSHPRPNARYKGITRTAYLPNNRRGNEVCEMLKVAFERKLVFTIGNSRTTGAEGVITWNDIHHKTDQKPNTQFGFPDPSYLDRVTDELKIKGITVDDIPTMSTPHRQNRK